MMLHHQSRREMSHGCGHMQHMLSHTRDQEGCYEGVTCSHAFGDPSAGWKRHADGSHTCQARRKHCVLRYQKSTILSFRKGFYAFSEGTSGPEGAFREGGFAPFSYMIFQPFCYSLLLDKSLRTPCVSDRKSPSLLCASALSWSFLLWSLVATRLSTLSIDRVYSPVLLSWGL